MKAAPDPATTVLPWVEKAERDWLAAKRLLALKEDGLLDAVCFHAQQCAEKYLKGLLVSLALHFPKTHDLEMLWGLLPRSTIPGLDLPEFLHLNRYTVEARYPGGWEPITRAEAARAVAAARKVRAAVRKRLPPEALRKTSPPPRRPRPRKRRKN